MLRLDGLKELDEFIAKLEEARAAYPQAKADMQKRIYVDWWSSQYAGGSPTLSRVEIKVTDE
jgi:hypothetical protein